jgi:FKBP-type peptidyl-prolyl cis-trans isomerase
MSFVYLHWLVPKSMQADLLASLGLGMSALGVSPAQVPAQAAIADVFSVSPISVEVLHLGSGVLAQPGDRVTVHFVVRTLEGKELANTVKRGMPFTVELDGMGSFWSTALDGTRAGAKSRLKANTSIFFGKNGILPIIPADTEIEADLTVLKIQKAVLAKK